MYMVAGGNQPFPDQKTKMRVIHQYNEMKPRPKTSKIRGIATNFQSSTSNFNNESGNIDQVLNKEISQNQLQSFGAQIYNTNHTQMKRMKPSCGSFLQSDEVQTTTQRATNSASVTGRVKPSGIYSQQSVIGSRKQSRNSNIPHTNVPVAVRLGETDKNAAGDQSNPQ